MKANFFNAFIGGSSGVFKGVCALEKCDIVVKNLDSLKSATNKNPVTAMSWSDDLEEEILIGYGSQLVKIYSLKSRSFTSTAELKCGEGPIVGISKFKGVLVSGVESGAVKVWGEGGSAIVIQAGNHMERLRQNPKHCNIAATGGKENDLRLWDLEVGKQTFSAKNVRHDSLEMRVPVWVTDICYIPNTTKVAVTTRHGHVRLYDPSSSTRRPVVNVPIPEQALTAIVASVKDHHVIVGSATGQMNLVDLRSKGLVMNKYKDFTGAIKGIACPEENPYIVSVSLDRNFRIHHLQTKELLFKEYVQSKMTCVLVKKDFNLSYYFGSSDEENVREQANTPVETDKEPGTSSDELDDLLKNLPTVGEKRPKTNSSVRKKHKS